MKKTVKVIYECHPGRGPASGGIVDAGAGAVATLEGDVLRLVGPKINYSIKNVASYTVEEVET